MIMWHENKKPQKWAKRHNSLLKISSTKAKKPLDESKTIIKLDLALLESACNMALPRPSYKIDSFKNMTTKIKSSLIFYSKYFKKFKQTISFQFETKTN